ncbi:root hair defective 3 GTP-binding protein-domain-containing protein [Dichotomocladium elegans]|nr:root hair defective 3 GTP-binding protein-domain-containing protein [Dichotomocladium elegans]
MRIDAVSVVGSEGSASSSTTVSHGSPFPVASQVLSTVNEYAMTVPLLDSDDLEAYIRDKWVLDDVSLDFHTVSIIGSQGSGKSQLELGTLLNALFGTCFRVRDAGMLGPATKGIWMSRARDTNTLVMDVQGMDDFDFDIKSTLFAMATSSVIIFNLWEHQVGLYTGANMDVLKLAFEMKLRAFDNLQKSTILLIIRDHEEDVSKEAVMKAMNDGLHNIWGDVEKPVGSENATLNDLFDFKFAALPHKKLLPKEFMYTVSKLRRSWNQVLATTDSLIQGIRPEFAQDGAKTPEEDEEALIAKDECERIRLGLEEMLCSMKSRGQQGQIASPSATGVGSPSAPGIAIPHSSKNKPMPSPTVDHHRTINTLVDAPAFSSRLGTSPQTILHTAVIPVAIETKRMAPPAPAPTPLTPTFMLSYGVPYTSSAADVPTSSRSHSCNDVVTEREFNFLEERLGRLRERVVIQERVITNLDDQIDRICRYEHEKFDEIAEFDRFSQGLATFNERVLLRNEIVRDLGMRMADIRRQALNQFDSQASRYHLPHVADAKRRCLEGRMNTHLKTLFDKQLENVRLRATDTCKESLQTANIHHRDHDIESIIAKHRDDAREQFIRDAQAMVLFDTNWSYDYELWKLDQELASICTIMKEEILGRSTRLDSVLDTLFDVVVSRN